MGIVVDNTDCETISHDILWNIVVQKGNPVSIYKLINGACGVLRLSPIEG